MTNQEETIVQLLAEARRIAVVGYSSRPEKPAHYVPQYLFEQGYEIIPVNAAVKAGPDGGPAYSTLQAIPDPVDLVLIFRLPELIPPVVDEAIEIGAKGVWMQLGIANEGAAEHGREAGLAVVQNACIMVEHQRRQTPLG